MLFIETLTFKELSIIEFLKYVKKIESVQGNVTEKTYSVVENGFSCGWIGISGIYPKK